MTLWREGAIWLETVGRKVTVRVERDGKWVEVIQDFIGDGAHTSHIIEPAGINAALKEPT